VVLRNKVLREPLGMSLSKDDLAQDQGDIHIAAFSHDELVGCLLLKPQTNTAVKMRQVAVSPDHQGKGIGRLLVEYSEIIALQSGFAEIVLNARETAVPFYLSLNYQIEGERFQEVGIPHFKMKKSISRGA
jgi:predicted GNAT family N-acyltransferase